jgi:DNA helicase-2/ATP-dependent DNA helicase PcrA
VLNYGDFAILRESRLMTMTRHGSDDPAVRYNALSRVIESALQKDSIPNRIVGGHKFFERMEIKDLLAYLQLAENPGFAVSFSTLRPQ